MTVCERGIKGKTTWKTMENSYDVSKHTTTLNESLVVVDNADSPEPLDDSLIRSQLSNVSLRLTGYFSLCLQCF